MRFSIGRQRLYLAGVLLASAVISSTNAATLTVNSTDDAGGNCPGPTCTLRQAIATAATGDAITFSLPANSAITLTSAELLINTNLTIGGPGANLLSVQRSTAPGTAVLRICNIAPDSVVATISGLTIANGNVASPGTGSAILNAGALLSSRPEAPPQEGRERRFPERTPTD